MDLRFVGKINEAMEMLADACAMNRDWELCQYCPFRKACDVLEKGGIDPPEAWE